MLKSVLITIITTALLSPSIYAQKNDQNTLVDGVFEEPKKVKTLNKKHLPTRLNTKLQTISVSLSV